MKRLCYTVNNWIRRDARYMLTDFWRSLSNLYAWFRTIWNDRNWDHSFIYTILAKKLEQQAIHIAAVDRHTQSQRDAEIMLMVVKLIKRVRDDYYANEYLDYAESKFDWLPVKDKPGYVTIEHCILSDRYDEYFAKYAKVYKQIRNGQIKTISNSWSDYPYGSVEQKHRIASCIAYYNQQRAKRIMFNIMHDQIEQWWN